MIAISLALSFSFINLHTREITEASATTGRTIDLFDSVEDHVFLIDHSQPVTVFAEVAVGHFSSPDCRVAI